MSMIQISNLTFAYEGGYGNIFENLSLQIDTSWKLGLVGRNGRGKTTLLKLLMGQYSYQGQISADTQFDYFPFTIEDPRQSALEAALGVCPDCPDWILLREFSKLKIEEETYRRPYITLSLGERTKILLAALFAKENRFLLIDEPTNHLDQPARRLVGDYLAGKQGFILVSHDRAFLDGCVDHILALEKTGVSEYISNSLVSGLGVYGPIALLAGIYFTTSLLTMFISNTATAVLLAPIALQSAIQIGTSPYPFLFAVTVGASMCFASPFSTPPNALVMPAGQYTFMDYIKVGLPLQILIGIVMILTLPLLFPF